MHPRAALHRTPQGVILVDERAAPAEVQRLQARGSTVLHVCDPSTATGLASALRRPLRRRLVAEKLRAVAGRAQAAPAHPRGETHTLSRSLRILVAEDHLVNQLLIRRFIEGCGQSCTIVPDGQAAVDAVREAPFDVIFMDCNMPNVDGYTATTRIRALALERQPRIVALTASAMAGDREQCLAAGMDDYLSKPVSRQSISQVLSALCGDANIA